MFFDNKNKKIMVVSPHADDESFGLGGTLLRLSDLGYEIAWLNVTNKREDYGYSKKEVVERNNQLKKVCKFLKVSKFFNLELKPSSLDEIPLSKLVIKFHKIFKEYKPGYLFIPHEGDVHSDHEIVFKTCISASKSFRDKNIKAILSYETLSETEFGLNENRSFNPNFFFDISKYISKKEKLLSIYSSELSNFPFPRSLESVKSLAKFRGSSSSFKAAEAFKILKIIN